MLDSVCLSSCDIYSYQLCNYSSHSLLLILLFQKIKLKPSISYLLAMLNAIKCVVECIDFDHVSCVFMRQIAQLQLCFIACIIVYTMRKHSASIQSKCTITFAGAFVKQVAIFVSFFTENLANSALMTPLETT